MRRLRGICAAALVLTLATALLCACSKSSTTANASQAQSSTNPNGELHYKVPDGWVVEKPTSNMRARNTNCRNLKETLKMPRWCFITWRGTGRIGNRKHRSLGGSDAATRRQFFKGQSENRESHDQRTEDHNGRRQRHLHCGDVARR